MLISTVERIHRYSTAGNKEPEGLMADTHGDHADADHDHDHDDGAEPHRESIYAKPQISSNGSGETSTRRYTRT